MSTLLIFGKLILNKNAWIYIYIYIYIEREREREIEMIDLANPTRCKKLVEKWINWNTDQGFKNDISSLF